MNPVNATLATLSHLPRQRMVLSQLLPPLQQTPWIAAAWLGGSLARGDADRWSDVNVHLLVAEDRRAHVRDWLTCWLHDKAGVDWLPLTDADGSLCGITRLDAPVDVAAGGVHFSLHWTDPGGVEAHLRRHPAHRLLFVRDGDATVPAALRIDQPSDLTPPDWNDLHDNLAFFWRPLSRLAAALNRNDHLAASALIAEARTLLIDLVVALNGARRPASEARIRSYMGPAQLEAFEKTLVAKETSAATWIGQAVALIVLYRWYAPQLVEIHGVPYPDALERTTLALLSAEVPGWPALIQTG